MTSPENGSGRDPEQSPAENAANSAITDAELADLLAEAEAVANAEADATGDAGEGDAGEGDAGEGDAAADSSVAAPDFEQELAERTEDLLRLTAEYANYRRRTERERKAAVEEGKAAQIKELLPILDDLDLAAQHGDLAAGPLKAFGDKFRATVESLGAVGFGEIGDNFDPELHEAVQDLSTGEEKVLATVLRKGYRLGDRVIRHAMVLIGDPTANPDNSPATEN
ncbi:nucleotide exchange factor GrpE [Corynebacterium caspium]|uniref:nucleotide exchange factor GrpE n=1 Tax=Corynebacterium caspium TaxID=234828 RepID=UPI00036B1B45|nr:nucleotide exchange factor GrpE [Corynebacterium caspium]WKD58633.1 heat shock protein GrpE [Corynebacterium caspium DSM 44850]